MFLPIWRKEAVGKHPLVCAGRGRHLDAQQGRLSVCSERTRSEPAEREPCRLLAPLPSDGHGTTAALAITERAP